jgi:hypothetical protein
MAVVELVAVKELEPFDFRWPESMEWFERGWSFDARITDSRFSGRHGIGAREVYGRMRVHTVTFLPGRTSSGTTPATDNSVRP